MGPATTVDAVHSRMVSLLETLDKMMAIAHTQKLTRSHVEHPACQVLLLAPIRPSAWTMITARTRVPWYAHLW